MLQFSVRFSPFFQLSYKNFKFLNVSNSFFNFDSRFLDYFLSRHTCPDTEQSEEQKVG